VCLDSKHIRLFGKSSMGSLAKNRLTKCQSVQWIFSHWKRLKNYWCTHTYSLITEAKYCSKFSSLRGKINAIRILKLIRNIKNNNILPITLRYNSHITKCIFIYTVKPLFPNHQNSKYITCAALIFAHFSCWICKIEKPGYKCQLWLT